MIDHVSVPVRDLAASTRFYETVLATLGMSKLEQRPATARLRQELRGILDQSARRSDAGRRRQRRPCLLSRAQHGFGRCLSRRRARGRRRRRRQTGPAPAARRRLLRRLHPRPRRQPHRGGHLPRRQIKIRAGRLQPPSSAWRRQAPLPPPCAASAEYPRPCRPPAGRSSNRRG